MMKNTFYLHDLSNLICLLVTGRCKCSAGF
jgi:hypothetical protein